MYSNSTLDEEADGRHLLIGATGDYEWPFCVYAADPDGIQLPPIALFEEHADALLFVEAASSPS